MKIKPESSLGSTDFKIVSDLKYAFGKIIHGWEFANFKLITLDDINEEDEKNASAANLLGGLPAAVAEANCGPITCRWRISSSSPQIHRNIKCLCPKSDSKGKIQFVDHAAIKRQHRVTMFRLLTSTYVPLVQRTGPRQSRSKTSRTDFPSVKL